MRGLPSGLSLTGRHISVADELGCLFLQAICQCAPRMPFPLLWPYHIKHIVKGAIPKHVQRAFHNQLTSLPWNKFYPDIQAMDLMVKVGVSSILA